MPEVSVIIPARNAMATIGEQLEALARQETARSWEVIVADNDSTDGTASFVSERAAQLELPNVRVVPANGQLGAAHARNEGAAAATSPILLFCDADDRVDPGWLDALVRCTEASGIAGGLLDRREINDASRLPSGTEVRGDLPLSALGPRFAVSANLGVMGWLFETLGGFDERLVTCEDVDFSLRARRAGHPPAFCEDAVVHYRDRENLTETSRQSFAYGRAEPLLAKLHGEEWGPRRTTSDALQFWGGFVRSIPEVRKGPAQRVRFVRRFGRGMGRLYGSFEHRKRFL